MNMKWLLRRIKWLPRDVAVLLIALKIRTLPERRRAKLTFAFDAVRAEDGTGAQIQRLIATKALSLILGCNYQHAPIEKIAIHPLDPFQDTPSMKKFVAKLNNEFIFHESLKQDYLYILEFPDLKVSQLWKLYIQTKMDSPTLVRVLNPYLLVDLLPSFYRKALAKRVIHNQSSSQEHKESIAVHYRQGVGGFVIYPGMKTPRQIPFDVYLTRLRKIVRSEPQKFSVKLFTDAPKKPTTFKPPKEQEHLWIGTPGFDNSTMTIKNFDPYKSLRSEVSSLEIHEGGDPLQAIMEISRADYILMSRSSLSYVAALLAPKSTVVFYPKNFWHPKLRGWKRL